MSLKASCEICRFSNGYPAPFGEPPEFPGYDADFMTWEIYTARMDLHIRFSQSVECRRFPKFAQRLKTDWCGEFQEDPLGPVAGVSDNE